MAKDDVTFDFQGLKEIDKMLSALPVDVQAKILRSINRKAAKKVETAMKANAPSEGIKNSIKIRADKYNKSGVLVGVMDTPESFHARFIEYGTESRETKAGENRGEMPKKPFIKAAIDSTVQEALTYLQQNYAELVNKGLERRVKAINKKLNK
jgi:HK97 gp10 family phage protein